ncbi:MAG TPA: HPF/RaiA family ribosome-associated protein [Geobacterales bacterium]|nr:HPF/RaiA family ribosome-associated protein [Geobacterales bacterium]
MKINSKDFRVQPMVIPAEEDAGTVGTGRRLPILSRTQIQEKHTMQVQINTGHNIEGHEALSAHVSDVVKNALVRLSDHITRVEVHLSDENGDKSGPNDKRCVMEARLEGRQPVAVTHQAATLDQAVEGAAHKLTRLIESTLGRLHDQASRRTDPLPPEPKAANPS